MKTTMLAVSTTLLIMAAPAFASTPTSGSLGTGPTDQTAQPQAGQYSGDEYGDAVASPFKDETPQDQDSDMSLNNARGHTDLQPLRRDASGVPDPRI